MKKISFVIFVTLLLNGAIATNSAFSGGGYWYFNEGSGLVAQDSSMNGNHGTLNGAVAWTVGKSGSALSFNGGSDRVLVPDAPSLDITGQITIAAWIKQKTTDTQYIVKKGRIRSTDGYELSLSYTGKVFVRFNQNSSGEALKVMSASNYPTGGATWMHVAATYDGLDIKLYINGVLEAVKPATLFLGANNNALSIGAQDDGSRPFLGVVDEVHLYSIPLTSEQVWALAGQGTEPPPPPPGGGFTDLWTKKVLNPVYINGSAAEKPQSKLWQYDGIWWAVFSNAAGTWLWRLDGVTWNNILLLSTMKTVRADTKLADNGIVHILLFNGSTSRLASLEYVPGYATYQFWSARPSVINLNLTGAESVTLDLDSTGIMWVEFDSGSTIQVKYSRYPYSDWTNPAILLANNIDGSDDIGAVTSLKNGRIGVLWSNQATRRFEFKYHIDGEDPTRWSGMETALGDFPNIGHGPADDHLNFATASDGTLYAAVKTSYDSSGYPVIVLLVRTPSGTWNPPYPVETNSGATRPIVILNELQGFLMVVYSDNNNGGNVVYKETSLSNISFGSSKLLLQGNNFTDVSSVKHNFTNDIVIMASPPTSSSLRKAEFVELTQ